MKGGTPLEDKNILNIGTRVQTIYYMNKEDLGITYATHHKKLKLSEASEILKQRDLQHDKILKVEYEFLHLELDLKTFENNLINKGE